MNVVDVIIILLLVSAVFRGLQAGLLNLLLSSAGFIGGLLAGSWVAKQIIAHMNGQLSKLIVVLVIEFGLALLLAAAGEFLAARLSAQADRLKLGRANQVLGAGLEILFTLAVVWLGASALINVQSYNIGHDVRNSYIVRQLDSALPRPPDIFAQLEKIISPNGFPNVFLGLEPRHTTVSPTNRVNNQAVLADEKSVVKIQGSGCGGIVFGSGFVVGKGIVVTNAHVVAGIARPQIVDSQGTYRATPIWFDPNLDIAVLRVSGLSDPALTLTGSTLPDSDAAAILGYPGGGPLVAGNAVIIDNIKAIGRNIYNQGEVSRQIYEVQGTVEPGNSGGPLLAPDGKVAGIIFAKSLSQNDVGYAILINQVKSAISQAEQQNSQVSTGSCTQN